MIIWLMGGGLGNQLHHYALGRRLAYKWNTELKLDLTYFVTNKLRDYVLDQFNITATIATPEEIQQIKSFHQNTGISIKKMTLETDILDYPDNVWCCGYCEGEKYFYDIADIIRKEFTLKNPLGATAQYWQKKILSADCSVSLHIRHGDFIYNPYNSQKEGYAHLPLNYYLECVNQLKQQYKNITAFIFSNNLQWVKENLRLDVPMEFVEENGLTDVEELYLMSLCQHNIIANSTFSWWAAWLNQNPDKKVFVPIPQSIVGTKKTYRRFSAERDENSPLQSDRWIRVPFDLNKQPDITMCPWFSLLLVVNNDAATISETLHTILNQDYKFFELIIIDNASFDGSSKICQQSAKASDKVTLIKLYNKVSNAMAWNMALNSAQGDSVMFLKGNDRFISNALSSLYMANERPVADIVNSVNWLRENLNGTIDISGRKFVMEKDLPFRDLQGKVQPKLDKMTLLRILSANANPVPLATKVFKRKFLLDNTIKFDEKLADDDAELLFMTETMFKSDNMLFTPNVFYVAPKANNVSGGGIKLKIYSSPININRAA